jgi:YVTN family beta-propeller protein
MSRLSRPSGLLLASLTVAAVASASASCGSSSSPPSHAGPTPGSDGGLPVLTGDGGAPGGPGPDSGAADGGAGSLDVAPAFTFESGPVRPVALSPDGTHLFVANTANSSLDVFTVSASGLAPAGSVYVGVDPVAVAARTSTEVWVVNQVSDSVSVVDTSTSPPRVVRTLLVGDEPSDIVFAGAVGNRAFITTAHRGQQRSDPSIAQVPGAGDPQLTTPGVGRADVWVFDATSDATLGTSVGGTPVAIVTLFGDTPRALAVTPDGSKVYAAIFKSGNQTTVTSSELPCAGFDTASKSTTCTVNGVAVPGAPPEPPTNYAGVAAPAVAVLLKADRGGAFRDVLGRDWTSLTEFTLPDEDVFAIDATSLATTATYLHVGTTLFDMAVNPKSGAVYVSNTEARNDLRFEGPGTFAGETLEGHLAESRITVLGGSGTSTTATPRYLNKHIDYAKLPAPAGVAAHSLATPTSVVVTPDGATMYVAAFGSSKIGVFPTQAIEDDSFDPTTASDGYIAVSGGGPGGIALDATNKKLYVTTRFDDGLSVIDLASGKETAHLQLVTREPTNVTAGRSFLYDATVSSSNGEAACASCHMFGDDDHNVWDLGAPDNDVTVTPITIKLELGAGSTTNGSGDPTKLHPNKGPMTTQTLRGMVNHGPMHWRGDRVSGFFGTDTRTAPPYDSELAFKNFILAFNSLLGLGPQFSATDMQTFADFALDIVMPPNPVRALDNSLTASQTSGQQFFLGCSGTDSVTGKPATCTNGVPNGTGHLADGFGIPNLGFTCQGCHVLDPAQGFFGTDGESSFEGLPQIVKIPQLRNLYDKVGMFGVPASANNIPGNNGPQGPQVRGSGFEHDGSVDTLFRFLSANVFKAPSDGKTGFAGGDPQRRDVEQFLLAFDSDLAPIVGQQVTLRADNAAAAGPRIDLLEARATTPFVSKILGTSPMECDLVARAVVNGAPVAFRLRPDRSFVSASGVSRSDADVRALATTTGQEVTFTCMPPGWLE